MSNGESSRFDAYYKWLGIPKKQQPPNHYRILALKLFETDAAAIESAAQRQSAFVLDCAKEKYRDLGQKLLAEIATARECLLNPETRSAYDEELKKQLSDAPSRRSRQSRYDVQVAHGADFEVPDVALPATAPAEPPTPEPVGLKDDPAPPVPSEPAIKDEPITLPFMEDLEPQKSARSPSGRAKKAAASAAARPPVGAAPAAPSPVRPPVAAATSDFNAGKIIKLVAVACIVAGGATIGVLKWLSSSRERISPDPTSLASIAQATAPRATTSPAAASAAKPATQASAVPSTRPADTKTPPVAARPNTATQPARAAAPASAPQPVQAAAPVPKPEPRSEFWPRLANTVVLVSPQQGGGPASVLSINEDGTFDSPNFGAGKWRLVGTTLFLDGKAGTVKFTYDPGRDVIIGDRGSGSIVARKPSAARPQPAAPASATPDQPAPATPAAAPAPAPKASEPGWVFPLRSVLSFRRAWIRGDAQGTVDFDENTDTVTIEAGEDLGGFAVRKPWKEISFNMHAETITGRLEIQVNKTTLKFNTATVLIRKPATIVIQYDPVTFKLTANVGSRQVASATVLEESFTSQVTCRFRCEGGKTKVKLSEVKVFVP